MTDYKVSIFESQPVIIGYVLTTSGIYCYWCCHESLQFYYFCRVQRLAEDICHDITSPLVALCVLKGGYQFFTDLLDCIKTRNATTS